MRRTWLVLVLTLIVSGCSREAPNATNALAQTTENTAAGPDVAPTAVPGVAITYAYSFVLPPVHVAAAQEQHATQCEALGSSRCRITAMEFHAAGRRIYGSLAFKLAPDLARRFGKQATASVVGQGGMLSDAEINSTDAGITIGTADRSSASILSEQKDLDAQLAKTNLPAAERTQLQARSQSLIDTRRQLAAGRADAALLLASTPMTFRYAGGTVDTELRDGPLAGALMRGWTNIIDASLFMLTLVITLLPWAGGIMLVIWLWRRFGARIAPPLRDDD
jgi:hypothetical protein